MAVGVGVVARTYPAYHVCIDHDLFYRSLLQLNLLRTCEVASTPYS